MSSVRKNRGRKTSRKGRRLGKRTEMGQRGTKLVVQLASFQRAKLIFWRWMLKILQWKQLQRSWITLSERRVWGLSADSGMWAILWKSRMCALGHIRLQTSSWITYGNLFGGRSCEQVVCCQNVNIFFLFIFFLLNTVCFHKMTRRLQVVNSSKLNYLHTLLFPGDRQSGAGDLSESFGCICKEMFQFLY